MGVVDQSTENKMGPRGHMCAHVSAEARIQIKKTTGDQRGGQGEKLILNSDQVTTSLCHRIRTTRIRSSWKRRRRNFPRSNLHNEVHSSRLRLMFVLTAQYSLGRVLVFLSFELYCPKIREPVFIQLLQEIFAVE